MTFGEEGFSLCEKEQATEHRTGKIKEECFSALKGMIMVKKYCMIDEFKIKSCYYFDFIISPLSWSQYIDKRSVLLYQELDLNYMHNVYFPC